MHKLLIFPHLPWHIKIQYLL